MKQNLLNKLWLRVCMIVAVMTTALAGTAWAAEEVTIKIGINPTNSTSTSYVVTDQEFTIDGVTFIMRNYNPSTGQIRGNQTSSSNNFYLYNTTAIPGTLKSVTINDVPTSGSNSFVSSKAYINTGSDAITSQATSGTNPNGSTWSDLSDSFFCISLAKGGTSGTVKMTGITIVYTTSGGSVDESVATTTVIDDSNITNTDVYVGTTAGSLSATVSTGEGAISGATVTWSGNNDAVATIDASTGAVTLVGAGVVTFTAAYAGVADEYKASSATYEMTVTNSNPNVSGTQTNPYTVAQARAAIDAGTGTQGVYATGIVSKIVTAYNSTYGNISYNISADGTEEADQLQAYRGKSYNGEWFTSADDIKVGDIVVVYGNLKKYNSTYEFDADNQLVSLDRPVVTTPTITANPTSLTGFTYVVDNGPSAAKTVSASGANLTANITLSLGNNSDFEMSTTEGSGYANSLTLTENAGTVAETTVYVRLKSDLAVGEYNGTITLTSEGAETVTVALAGSVTAPEAANVTWDLSTNSYDEVTNENVVTWSSAYVTMTNSSENGGTKASNYLGGDANNRTSSRFYNGNNLTIAPALGYMITSIEFVATSTSYASALEGSTWENATATASGTTVTVTPTNGAAEVSAVIGGTCGFTSVKVYYQTLADFAPVWSALPAPTITVGEAYEFYPSNYVTGLPAPSITLETSAPGDTYDYDNGYFLFSSNTAGEYTFNFTATNTEGSASATLTITVETAPVPVASISLGDNEINALAEGTDGVILVDYKNITNVMAEIFFCDADGNAATYDWVTASINSINNVVYVINANPTTSARTAYMKVYALDDDANDVYSELITITQAGIDVDYATLPFTWNGGTKDELLAENGVTANGLGSDYAASNAPYRVKLDGTGDHIDIKTDCQPVLVSLDVKMLGGSNTSTITVQESNDGVTFTDVEDLAIEGVQNDVLYLQTASAFDAATRYVRLYFTKGSNVGVGGITIEKEFEETATVGAAGYATYVTKHNVSFPAGVTAYIGAVNGKYLSMTEVASAPKGTPVVLKGEGTYTLIPTIAADLADVSSNELKAAETDVVADGTQYVLAKPAGKEVGFYLAATGSTIAAGKAYLEVVSTTPVKGFTFIFGDDATGIEMVNGQSSMVNDPIFNLAGQRIQKIQKGINIVNGKKILR